LIENTGGHLCRGLFPLPWHWPAFPRAVVMDKPFSTLAGSGLVHCVSSKSSLSPCLSTHTPPMPSTIGAPLPSESILRRETSAVCDPLPPSVTQLTPFPTPGRPTPLQLQSDLVNPRHDLFCVCFCSCARHCTSARTHIASKAPAISRTSLTTQTVAFSFASNHSPSLCSPSLLLVNHFPCVVLVHRL
jgi:hypothetical protein